MLSKELLHNWLVSVQPFVQQNMCTPETRIVWESLAKLHNGEISELKLEAVPEPATTEAESSQA